MYKYVDHDQHRKEILTQCFELFAQKGYASITMRQISEALGVSTGTLYYYFPNKKILFEQLVEQLLEQDILAATAQLETAPTTEARVEAILNFVAQHEHYFFRQLLIIVDFYQQQGCEVGQSKVVLKQAAKRYRQVIAELTGIQDSAITTLISSTINGLILERMVEGEEVSFTEQATVLGQMLATYLKQKR